jgi:hypothetical protein
VASLRRRLTKHPEDLVVRLTVARLRGAPARVNITLESLTAEG